MKKSIIVSLLLASIFISCEKDSPINTQIQEQNIIPIDSIYLSFKINGELVELSSPSFSRYGGGQSLQRINRLANNAKDSAIIRYINNLSNDDYDIEIGLSNSLLVDTTTFKFGSEFPNFKNEIFKIGSYPLQFIAPSSEVRSLTTKYIGFYIRIHDLKREKCYISYLENSVCNNLPLYESFKANFKFQITTSAQLNSGIYSNYINTWFIESTFSCNLYINNDTENPEILTDGVLRGCF